MTRTVSSQQASVLAGAVAGDEVAFRRIIAAHHDDMRRVAVYITRDPALADDATQAAWIIAWKKLGNVRDEAHLRPWLVSVAANEAKRLLRTHRRRARAEVLIVGPDPADGIDPATGIATMDLRAALERLAPDDRALLAMRYVAGLFLRLRLRLLQRRYQGVLLVLAEHRQLPRHPLALSREAHGLFAVLVGIDLDEANSLDLIEDGVELGVVVGHERIVAIPAIATVGAMRKGNEVGLYRRLSGAGGDDARPVDHGRLDRA